MVDQEVVVHRLGTLRLNARRLASIMSEGRDRFIAEEDLYLKAERCLQLAIQAMLDIGTHIIADQGLAPPTGSEDIIPELGRAAILPADLVVRLAGIAGLRNILVHDYLAVDHGLLFNDLTSGLADFEDFARAIDEFLSTTP